MDPNDRHMVEVLLRKRGPVLESRNKYTCDNALDFNQRDS